MATRTDREILYLRKIVALLESLTAEERERCVAWLMDRFGKKGGSNAVDE